MIINDDIFVTAILKRASKYFAIVFQHKNNQYHQANSEVLVMLCKVFPLECIEAYGELQISGYDNARGEARPLTSEEHKEFSRDIDKYYKNQR